MDPDVQVSTELVQEGGRGGGGGVEGVTVYVRTRAHMVRPRSVPSTIERSKTNSKSERIFAEKTWDAISWTELDGFGCS